MRDKFAQSSLSVLVVRLVFVAAVLPLGSLRAAGWDVRLPAIEQQLGVRLATRPPARVGEVFQGVVENPTKLPGFGFPGVKPGDGVSLKITGPDAFEILHIGSRLTRSFTFDALGQLRLGAAAMPPLVAQRPVSPPPKVAPQGMAAKLGLTGIPSALEMADQSAVMDQDVSIPITLKFLQPGVPAPGQDWNIHVSVDGQDFDPVYTMDSTAPWKLAVRPRPLFSQGTHILEARFDGFPHWSSAADAPILPSKVKAKLLVVKAETALGVGTDLAYGPAVFVAPGTRIKLYAVLRSQGNGKNVEGKLILFKANGQVVGSASTISTVSEDKNVAVLNYEVPIANPRPLIDQLVVEGFFSGDDYYQSSSGKSPTYKVGP